MCGIAGIWNRNNNSISKSELELMIKKMRHRGPDAKGIWMSQNFGLGHSRLKIIDLSNRANQPFTNGEDVLVFNGEIFNFKELKKQLPSMKKYKTSSDTEVLFHSLKYWGTEALNKIEGQFAFAFFDKKSNSFLLARDHVGICPLYIMENDNELIFSSEIKPILEIRKSSLDHQGTLDYFAYRYNIQNSHTLFSNIKRFPPANYWKIDLGKNEIIKNRYWRLNFTQNNYLSNHDIQKQFNNIFDKEIKSQTVSDVPVGMYLSGGIDSGALLQGFSKTISDINTFTIGFAENDNDLIRVKRLQNKLSFKNNILPFNPESFESIEDVVLSLEEPFGDLIICANYLLAKYASENVKVVLSGEGGDEAFIGYDHQRAFLKMLRLSKIPLINSSVSLALSILPPKLLAIANGYPGGFGYSEKSQIKNTFANINSPVDAYIQLITLFKEHELKTLFKSSFLNKAPQSFDRAPLDEIFMLDDNIWQSVMRAEIEQLTLIINLLKQERLGMRFSLEGRVPLVSRKILDFAASLPLDKIYNKINKQYLIHYSKTNVLKKRPFSILANPKYKMMISLLIDKYITKSNVDETGILEWDSVSEAVSDLKSGSMLKIKKTMSILVFLIWWSKYKYFLKN